MVKKIIFVLVLTCISTFCFPRLDILLADDMLEDEYISDNLFNDQTVEASSKLPVINASAAIVMDMESGRILFNKDAKKIRAIASTTKIMTGILVLERGNLDDIVTVSKRAASVWGSDIDLKVGQKIKLRELLYGLMINSGNDAAIAVAEHIGGSVESFVEIMNEKARELGAYDTSYKSPHGLDMEGHFSTPYDLAIITRYALRNEAFSKIVKTVTIPIEHKVLRNTNEMLTLYHGADGVKTGYTGQAGRCLVTSATREGRRLISVVLNAPTRSARAQSSKAILDYAFNNYKTYTLQKNEEFVCRIKVEKGLLEDVPIITLENISLPLRLEEYESIEKIIELPKIIEAPVGANIEIGNVVYMVNGEELIRSALKTGAGVAKKDLAYYIKTIFKSWVKLMRDKI